MANRAEEVALDWTQPFKLSDEHRFPLDLNASEGLIWDAYERSLVEVWDPEDDQLWIGLDLAENDSGDRGAAALVWSHRAWVDFTSIAESEAVLVKLCLERDVAADFKYCVSMRAVERARSAELAYLLAEKLDHYQTGPATPELVALLDDELVRRALHDGTSIDAFIAAHLVGQATVDLQMWEAAARSAGPTLAKLIGLVTRDKARMIEVAWQYLGQVVPTASEQERLNIGDDVTAVLADEEARGRQVPALLGDGLDRERLLEAHSRAAAAGLGGIPGDEQVAVFDAAVTGVGSRLADLGVVTEPPALPRP
jgi:hypothetical protein